jgi:hypothetical protein
VRVLISWTIILALKMRSFFRDRKPQQVGENDIFGLITQVRDSAVPVRSPNTQALISVGEAKDASVFNCSSPKGTVLKWQSLFALLLCGGTVRMTVEYYETLRETLV